MKSQENDPAARQKMMEILKRVHEADMENGILEDNLEERSSSGEDYSLDSDDDQEVIKDRRFRNLFITKCSFLCLSAS